ncbi:MAG: sulfatase, partial [Deltaproteobacteria bacterium]|nr:sulfatase [Deltaproteobacteria bacterium]
MGGTGADRAWVRGLCLLLIVGPYFYYAWFAWTHLNPIEFADAVTYLWPEPLNVHYWTNRSLTQRLLYSLLGNRLGAIAAAQLFLFLLTAVGLFGLLARRGKPLANLALAAALAFVFSSYAFNASAVAISAEPVFLCLLLLFPCVLFLERGRFGAHLVLAVGLAFVFSRNLAPFTLLALLAVRLLAARRGPDRVRWGVYSLLVAASLASIAVTARHDTSLSVNTVNNIYRRVLPVPELVERFHAKHGMPDGPWVEACSGKYVLDPCIGRPLLTVDPVSRNYALLEDRQGFVRWARDAGRRAYLSHLFWDDPMRTHTLFQMHFARYASDDGIRFPIRHLGKQRPSNVPNNRASIEASGVGREVGFLGFDSLSLLRDTLLPLGFARLHSLIFLIAVGIALCRALPASGYLALGTGMLAGGLASFFLAYFGDAVEIPRHVFPPLVLLVLGGVVYWLSLFGIAARELSRARAQQRLVAAAALLAGLPLACGRDPGDVPYSEPQSVFLIVLDAASAAYFGTYGDPHGASPHIDALAAESIVFENAYGQSASTPPSVASLLTGVRSRTHRIDGTSALSPWLQPLPEILNTRGFATIGVVSNPLAAFQLDRGFDTYVRAWELAHLQKGRAREDELDYVVTRPSDINEQVIPLLRGLAGSRVLAYVHYLQPHFPYDPPTELRNAFDPPPREEKWDDLYASLLAANRSGSAAAGTIEALEARYRANLRWVDTAVGELLDWLRAADRYDDALLVLTSDHGDAFFGHHLFGHNSTLYDDMTRVPLLVKPHRGSGIEPRRIANPVEGVDVAPTILDAVGIPPAGQFEGDSLLPLMRAEVAELPGFEIVTSTIRLRSDAVRIEEYKLIRHSDGSEELYDLDRDP